MLCIREKTTSQLIGSTCEKTEMTATLTKIVGKHYVYKLHGTKFHYIEGKHCSEQGHAANKKGNKWNKDLVSRGDTQGGQCRRKGVGTKAALCKSQEVFPRT